MLKLVQYKFVLLILLFLTTSCSNTSKTGFLITRGVIENHCEEKITDIKIIHLPTHAVATFSGIFSGTTAEIGFQSRSPCYLERRFIFL